MEPESKPTVWVITQEGAPLPCGIFQDREAAVRFIEGHSLCCTLSEFPLNESTYDHALRLGLFSPKKPHEFETQFVGEFSPRLPHFHFTSGRESCS